MVFTLLLSLAAGAKYTVGVTPTGSLVPEASSQDLYAKAEMSGSSVIEKHDSLDGQLLTDAVVWGTPSSGGRSPPPGLPPGLPGSPPPGSLDPFSDGKMGSLGLALLNPELFVVEKNNPKLNVRHVDFGDRSFELGFALACVRMMLSVVSPLGAF